MKSDTSCWIFATLMFMVFTFAAPGPAATASGGPRAVVPESSFDFGTTCEGNDVRHLFTIENTGDAPLRIIDVKTD
jgi:hypothetical protein